jgi:hypothetical protein
MKRNPSGSSLEGVYKENGGSSIHVSHSQAKGLSKTDSGTVQDQNQRPVEYGSEVWPLEISAERQEMENILFRKKIRNEGGLRRKVRPDRFSYGPWFGGSPQVAVELPKNRSIARHADRLSPWLTRQPSNRRSVKLPMAVSGRVLDEKTIEFAQRKFRAFVAITEAPLEIEKRMQLPRSRALEKVAHRGTGRVTARRRFNATRT